MVGIRDMQNNSSYHFALRARLLQRLTRCHDSYLRECLAFPIFLSTPERFIPADRKFQELKALYPTPPPPALLKFPK